MLRLGPEPPDPTALARAATERKLPLQIVTLHEPEVLHRYDRRLVLVRPDGHVAWRGDEIPRDPEALIDRVCGVVADLSGSERGPE